METSARYILVGLFVLVSLAAAAMFAVWMAQTEFDREQMTFEVAFKGPVRGLSTGAEARFNGIRVGEVEDLRFDPDDPSNVIATVLADARTPIRTDSQITLDFVGLTGLSFVQIRAGSESARLISDLPRVPPPRLAASQTQLEGLVEGGEDALFRLNEAITRVNNVLSDENVARFSSLLANVDAITESVANERDLGADLSEAIAAMDVAAKAVEASSIQFDANVQQAASDFAILSRDVAATLETARSTLERTETAVASGEEAYVALADSIREPASLALRELQLTAQQMRALTGRLNQLAAEIEGNPREFLIAGPESPKAEGVR